jgi:NitT/TauT family transport system substrate-binding protein
VAVAPLVPPQKVRLSYTQSSGEVPLYVGIEQGYFTEMGIDVELVRIPGSADTIVLITTDQLEAGGLLITPAFYNAVARNVGVRMVADRGSNIGGPSAFSLTVRSDILQQRPWSGYQDLRGLKVAVPQRGSMAEYYLELMLQRGGLQMGDVDLVAPLTFPEMSVAFANKGIDAALYLEPWATQQVEEGVIRKVSEVGEVAPGSHTAALVYGDTFARNTAAARSFMVGWLRSVRHTWDAYGGRRDVQEVYDAVKAYTTLKDDALIRKLPPTHMNPNGALDPARLAAYQDWFADRGLIPQKAEMAKLYDPSFAEYATSALGPYQVP